MNITRNDDGRDSGADPQLTDLLRHHYAAPLDEHYWSGLEARVMQGMRLGIVPLNELHVNGHPLSLVPQLPRCGCFLRGHRGQLPATLASLIADTPTLSEQLQAVLQQKIGSGITRDPDKPPLIFTDDHAEHGHKPAGHLKK
jgi:hypothetical protein